MSGTLEAYGGPTEGVTKVCGCGTLEVLDDADAFSRMYERDSETGPVVLGAADAGCGRRGGVDGGDVRAGAVLLAAAAGVGAGAGAGLALYGGAAPVRPVSADRRFVIQHSGHHWRDELQASGLPSAELCCACRDLSCVDQRGTSAYLDTARSRLQAPTP